MTPAATKPGNELVLRHSKPLDIRKHKAAWLNIEHLRKLQADLRKFADFVLAHPRKVIVEHCYICRSEKRRPFAVTYGIPYHECQECAHVYAGVRLSPEDLAAYYKQEYFVDSVFMDESVVEQRQQMVQEPKLSFVAEFVRTARRKWLDVGTGNGAVVACARGLGFDAHGLELGTQAIEFARKVFHVELSPRSIYEELRHGGPAAYDVISFFMVLEHATDPCEQVAAASELLAPGGLLAVEVPTATSLSAISDSSYPDHGLRQCVGDHIMLYSEKSVTRLVESSGFRVEGIWYMGQDVFNLVIHLALQDSAFLQSKLCDFLLDNNNVLQAAVDHRHFSDEIVLVARKE